MDANVSTTIGDIRAFIHSNSGKSPSQISFGNTILHNDNELLSDIGIGSQSVIEYEPPKTIVLNGTIGMIKQNSVLQESSYISIPIVIGTHSFFADAKVQIRKALKRQEIKIKDKHPMLFVFRNGRIGRNAFVLLRDASYGYPAFVLDDSIKNVRFVDESGLQRIMVHDCYKPTTCVVYSALLKRIIPGLSTRDALVWYPRVPKNSVLISTYGIMTPTYYFSETICVFIVNIEKHGQFTLSFERGMPINGSSTYCTYTEDRRRRNRKCVVM